MKLFTSLLFISLFALTGFSQTVEIPEDIELKSKEDYKNSESLVKECIDWYHNTPLGDQPDHRKEVSAFLLQWLTGSPTVSIEIASGIFPMDCPECLVTFMNGWTQYALNNDYSKDKVAGALAGAQHLIEFYKKNKSVMGKQKEIEKLIKLQKKDELKAHIEKIME